MQSQELITLRGQVSDSITNVPLENANILVRNTPIGALTNEKGLFILRLLGKYIGDTIIVSYLGYKTQKFTITGNRTYNTELVPEMHNIGEVEVLAGYSARGIIKQVHKRIKYNYPLNEAYCAKAWFREYQLKNGRKTNVFELLAFVHDFDFAKYSESSDKRIDTVYTLETGENLYYDAGVDFVHTWSCREYITEMVSGKGTYIMDSITNLNGDRLGHITFIPRRSKTVTYEMAGYSEDFGQMDCSDSVITVYDSTRQYYRRYHFIVNLTDYAYLSFSEFYIKFSKPVTEIVFKDITDSREEYLCLNYRKKDGKYYPDQITLSYKVDVYKNNKIKEIDYRADVYSEYKIVEIYSDCDSLEDLLPWSEGMKNFESKCESGPKSPVLPSWFRDEVRRRYVDEAEE